jgi:hypothetical protein
MPGKTIVTDVGQWGTVPRARRDAYIVPDWPAPRRVRALSTTRRGGFSQPPFDGFNLGMHVGDDACSVAANRAQLTRDASLPGVPGWLNQVHGNRVIMAQEGPVTAAADGAIAVVAGRVCVAMTADCLPVLLCDRKGTRVGVAHAGWRGLVKGVLGAAVTAMQCAPEEIMAWLGPAIGPDAFEVGDEVRRAFLARSPATGRCFRPSPPGRWLADLYGLARLQLQSLGVGAIYGGGWCTCSDPERFFSYRRDGVTGRMATLIWLTA